MTLFCACSRRSGKLEVNSILRCCVICQALEVFTTTSNVTESGVGSGPWEQLPIPIAHCRPGHPWPDLLWSPGLLLSCLLFSFMGPVLLIVCEYLHMLTVYRFWLWVVKLLRTHHSSLGTLVMMYRIRWKMLYKCRLRLQSGAAQTAINIQDKNWLFQYVISFTFCKA